MFPEANGSRRRFVWNPCQRRNAIAGGVIPQYCVGAIDDHDDLIHGNYHACQTRSNRPIHILPGLVVGVIFCTFQRSFSFTGTSCSTVRMEKEKQSPEKRSRHPRPNNLSQNLTFLIYHVSGCCFGARPGGWLFSFIRHVLTIAMTCFVFSLSLWKLLNYCVLLFFFYLIHYQPFPGRLWLKRSTRTKSMKKFQTRRN